MSAVAAVVAAESAPEEEPKPALSFYVQGKPVSVNALYGVAGKRVRRSRQTGKLLGPYFLTQDALDWLVAIHADTVIACRNADWQPRHDGQYLRLRLTFYGSRADADNLVKATVDGLKHALLVDDRYFSPVEAVIGSRSTRHPLAPGAVIEVWEQPEEETTTR